MTSIEVPVSDTLCIWCLKYWPYDEIIGEASYTRTTEWRYIIQDSILCCNTCMNCSIKHMTHVSDDEASDMEKHRVGELIQSSLIYQFRGARCREGQWTIVHYEYNSSTDDVEEVILYEEELSPEGNVGYSLNLSRQREK